MARKKKVSWIVIAVLTCVTGVLVYKNYKASDESVQIHDVYYTESGNVIISYTKRGWWQGNRGPRHPYIIRLTPGRTNTVETGTDAPVMFLSGAGDSLYTLSDDLSFGCISKTDLTTFLDNEGVERMILKLNPEIGSVSGGLKFRGKNIEVLNKYGERFELSPNNLRIVAYDPLKSTQSFLRKRYSLCDVCQHILPDSLDKRVEIARRRWKGPNIVSERVAYEDRYVALIGDKLRTNFVRLEDSTFSLISERVFIGASLLAEDYLIHWSELNAFVITHVKDLESKTPIITVINAEGELFDVYPADYLRAEETLQFARMVNGKLLLIYNKGTILLVGTSGRVEWEYSL